MYTMVIDHLPPDIERVSEAELHLPQATCNLTMHSLGHRRCSSMDSTAAGTWTYKDGKGDELRSYA